MTKTPITMETRRCPICQKEWETGNILIDQKLRDTFQMRTSTGIAVCPEHRALVDSGDYVALIEVRPEVDQKKGIALFVPTGDGALISKDTAIEVFRMDVSPYNYVEIGV